MRQLYLLRHGKSNWANSQTSDFERELNVRGKSDAHHLGLHMDKIEDGIELVLCSSAKRTCQTLEELEACWSYRPSISIDDTLYNADKSDALTLIAQVSNSTRSILIIGHNPLVWELAHEFSPQGEVKDRISQRYPTCSLTSLVFESDSWNIRNSVANYASFLTPKDLLA